MSDFMSHPRGSATRTPAVPEPGHYLAAIVRRGWKVPVKIDLTDGRYSFTIDGEPAPETWSPDELLAALAEWVMGELPPTVMRVCLWGQPTTAAVYEARLATKAWAKVHAKDHPCLTPHQPMGKMLPPEMYRV